MIEFNATISYGGHNFYNYSMLLEYLDNRLLPICGSSRGYKFKIKHDDYGVQNFSDLNSNTNVIASLLQMPGVKHYAKLAIEAPNNHPQLPIEAISNWLERSADGIENKFQNTKEKFLEVKSLGINNAQVMLEHLKTVFFDNFI